MSDRTPATEKGTADRIEADDGGYWVRLLTKQALVREGECMQNCLARGHWADTAGEEDLVSTAVWSLRKADGVSYMDVSVVPLHDDMLASNAEGPKNSQPSGWSCRQLRHLVAAFRDAGATLCIHKGTALTGEDGRTSRPDKAPQDVKDAYVARQQREADEGLEAARARGDTPYLIRNDAATRATLYAGYRGIFRDGPAIPPVEVEERVSVTGGGTLVMTDALDRGLESGLIHRINVDGGETVLTLRISGPVADTLVANRDHTYALYLEGRDRPPSYPVVAPMGDVDMCDDPFLVRVRLPPVATVVRRRHGHIREQVLRQVRARLSEGFRSLDVREIRTGPGTIEGVATIPSGAQDGDLFDFIGPDG